jgi:hypothetical protein
MTATAVEPVVDLGPDLEVSNHPTYAGRAITLRFSG